VDGGDYQTRRVVTQVLATHLNSCGFAKVQERVGPEARREPIPPVALYDGESTQERLQQSWPQVLAQPVTFVVPDHNPREPSENCSTVYSGRAECMRDVEEVHGQLMLANRAQGGKLALVGTTCEFGYLSPGAFSGEVMVEFRFAEPVAQADICDAISRVTDTHVLYQTLLPIPLVNNPCERDFERD
jgi:hypothetical protein